MEGCKEHEEICQPAEKGGWRWFYLLPPVRDLNFYDRERRTQDAIHPGSDVIACGSDTQCDTQIITLISDH